MSFSNCIHFTNDGRFCKIVNVSIISPLSINQWIKILHQRLKCVFNLLLYAPKTILQGQGHLGSLKQSSQQTASNKPKYGVELKHCLYPVRKSSVTKRHLCTQTHTQLAKLSRFIKHSLRF